jgi:molecular chaperone HtpG
MTEGIVIPGRLRDLLARDSELSGAVTVILARYSDWLAESRLVFFPEYTDHGPKHIANVLAASNRLIADDAFPILSPQDAGALVIAALLHDIALHLTQQGFCRLALGQTALQPVSDLGDERWPALWEQFRAEAIRFSGAENMRLFGDPAAVAPPPLDQWNWNKKQDLLVGEFIRRHHARLAHQIALYGFPGSEREELELSSLLPASFRDVAGLIARSHGMPLRPCTDYLQRKHFNRLDPSRVHALFLMCVLRIADYIQIESDRAPVVRLRMSPLRSPVSIQEWKKHHSVGELTPDENDPEAYTILVTPEKVDCVRTYLQIRTLLDSIQGEIDQSWAVLGEVYGRQRDSTRLLHLLGLTMGRVRSNLDDPHFLRRLPFEPVGLRFRSADAKLFKLLIEPLYGGDANIGVRELLQNSIDAVRELDAFCKRHRKDKKVIELPDQPAEVVVELVEDTRASPVLPSETGALA